MKKANKTRQDIIIEMAKKFRISENEAGLFVHVFCNEISNAVLDGNRVEIRRFGVFKSKEYEGYTGRNPLNQVKIPVKSKIRPKFKPGATLRALVNQGKKS